MNAPRNMILFFQNHPLYGSIAAIVGPIIGFVTNFFTSDSTVKSVGIMSVYLGFFIGILTGLLHLIKLYEKISSMRKDKEKPKQ